MLSSFLKYLGISQSLILSWPFNFNRSHRAQEETLHTSYSNTVTPIWKNSNTFTWPGTTPLPIGNDSVGTIYNISNTTIGCRDCTNLLNVSSEVFYTASVPATYYNSMADFRNCTIPVPVSSGIFYTAAYNGTSGTGPNCTSPVIYPSGVFYASLPAASSSTINCRYCKKPATIAPGVFYTGVIGSGTMLQIPIKPTASMTIIPGIAGSEGPRLQTSAAQIATNPSMKWEAPVGTVLVLNILPFLL